MAEREGPPDIKEIQGSADLLNSLKEFGDKQPAQVKALVAALVDIWLFLLQCPDDEISGKVTEIYLTHFKPDVREVEVPHKLIQACETTIGAMFGGGPPPKTIYDDILKFLTSKFESDVYDKFVVSDEAPDFEGKSKMKKKKKGGLFKKILGK